MSYDVFWTSIFLGFCAIAIIMKLVADNFTNIDGVFRWFVLSIILTMASNDIDKQVTKLDDETKTTILVSTSPPKLGTSGEGYYGFMYGSFYVDNDIAYIVRTEKDGGYKDLVVKDTLIKEDSSLSDKGYLKEYYSCRHIDVNYRLWLFPVKGESSKECKLIKKVIYVPKGAVQKGVKI